VVEKEILSLKDPMLLDVGYKCYLGEAE